MGRQTEAVLNKLMRYMVMQDGLCQIGRHELKNEEWELLGVLRRERERLSVEGAKSKAQSAEG